MRQTTDHDSMQNRDATKQIVELWDRLSQEQRELLIPRLLYSTALGEQVRETGLAWRPAYMAVNRMAR